MNISQQKKSQLRQMRKGDPYLDRRTGEDRRQVHSLDYFARDGIDRRSERERRIHPERRMDCIPVNKWSSVCPDSEELDKSDSYYVIDLTSKRW